MDTFPYIGSLTTEDGECTTEFRTRLNRGRAIGGTTAEYMEKSQHTDFNDFIRLMKALVWLVATYCRESWTLRKSEETRLDAFKVKGLKRFYGYGGQQRKQRKQISWSKEGTVSHCQGS